MIGGDPFIDTPLSVDLLETRLVESHVVVVDISELKDILAGRFGTSYGFGERVH